MKKKSLARRFEVIFILFMVATIVLNGIMTYVHQTDYYHKECVRNIRDITEHLSELISKSGDEIINLKNWYDEYPDEVLVPKDFREQERVPMLEEEFLTYLSKRYADKTFGKDITFGELDHEGQRLFVIWRFAYWLSVFYDAASSFGLTYVYFVCPEEGEEYVVNYMFDPTFETMTDEDGEEIVTDYGVPAMLLERGIYEDPSLHRYMWEAWEKGGSTDKFDVVDNQYGHEYTYNRTLVIGGEKIGILCADISVKFVNSTIISAVVWQTLLSLAVLILTMIALFRFISKRILTRILRLERGISEYTDRKDPALAGRILAGNEEDDEIGTLSESFAGMITELDDYMNHLQRVTAEKERIGAELNVATQIQAEMLPRIFPMFPAVVEYELYATMTPAKEVGGDFYDFFSVDDRHIALVIADVSGKGVPAALFMVIAKTLIKNRMLVGEKPAEALMNVNDQLCENNESSLFVTVWLALVDIETGHVTEANAGHEYPALRRKDGEYELIKTRHSPAVAIMEGMVYRQREYDLEPGDSLYVYTDGVTEATDAHNELFGEERLTEVLNRNASASPCELLPAVRKSIDEFVGDAPQFDDITMLGFHFVKRRPAAEE